MRYTVFIPVLQYFDGEEERAGCFALFVFLSVIVVWLFLEMSRVCLQFVIVVFPDHAHLLFLNGQQPKPWGLRLILLTKSSP